MSSTKLRHHQPLIPKAQLGGRPRKVRIREIINAIFYILAAGCAWRMMLHDLPPWPTVYSDVVQKFRSGSNTSFEQLIFQILRSQTFEVLNWYISFTEGLNHAENYTNNEV